MKLKDLICQQCGVKKKDDNLFVIDKKDILCLKCDLKNKGYRLDK
jgi:hypothetical protein